MQNTKERKQKIDEQIVKSIIFNKFACLSHFSTGHLTVELSESESSPSAPLRVKTTFMPSGDEALHFGPLCVPPVDRGANLNQNWYQSLIENIKSGAILHLLPCLKKQSQFVLAYKRRKVLLERGLWQYIALPGTEKQS